jgi:SAM-dependent methyltransferase
MAQAEGVTPSQEDLLTELQALKLVNPDMGAKKMQAAVKEKNPTWLVSEARIKKVATEADLLAPAPEKPAVEGAAAGASAAVIAASTARRAQGGKVGNKQLQCSSTGGAVTQTARSEPSGHEKLRQLHNNCKRALINAHVRRGAGTRVLDVGCGRGGDLGKWKDAGASHVHCVDPDEQSLVGSNGVMERAAFLRFPVTTQLGTVLDVVAGEYDIVCYNFSLHYIAPRLAESCAVIAQRLRPGGLFIGICPDYDSIMAMGCPFTDRLGNSFRMQDDVLFVAVADPSAPFYAGVERPEPVLHRQLLQSELERQGVRLQSWVPMLQRRNGLISDMYSTFEFRKDR